MPAHVRSRSASSPPRCWSRSASRRASRSAASGAAPCCWSPSTPPTSRAASGRRSRRPPSRSETCSRPIVLLVLSRTLTEEQFLAWGWRIGFWLSVVIVAIGYYIRTRVTDAPIFLEVQKQVEQEEHVRYGVLEVLRRYPRGVFTAMGLRFAENIMYYLVVTFSITYLVVNEVEHRRDPRLHGDRAHRAHDRHPAHRRARRPHRPQAGVLHRRGARRHVGLLRLPDVRHEEPGRSSCSRSASA